MITLSIAFIPNCINVSHTILHFMGLFDAQSSSTVLTKLASTTAYLLFHYERLMSISVCPFQKVRFPLNQFDHLRSTLSGHFRSHIHPSLSPHSTILQLKPSK